MDSSNCCLENYLLPQTSLVIDPKVSIYKLDSPSAERNIEFIQKTEKLLRSAVEEIAKLELDIPRLQNELKNIDTVDYRDNEVVSGLKQELLADRKSVRVHMRKDQENRLSAFQKFSSNLKQNRKVPKTADDKMINKFLLNNCSSEMHGNLRCKGGLAAEVNRDNINKQKSEVLLEIEKNHQPIIINENVPPSESKIPSLINEEYISKRDVETNPDNINEQKSEIVLEIEKNSQPNFINETVLPSESKTSSVNNDVYISKCDIKTNTEKFTKNRNVQNSSVISIKSQRTVTCSEVDSEPDIFHRMDGNLIKQNLPCINIKPALKKQIGPTVHIAAASKFTMKVEKNKNVAYKEFVHSSCKFKTDHQENECFDKLENRQNNMILSVPKHINENKKSGEFTSMSDGVIKINSVYPDKVNRRNHLVGDGIEIDRIQERLRSVVRFYTEKLQSCENKATYCYQRLIKTLKILNDIIMKLYDDQMSDYIQCGESNPVKPPLSYRMKTVTDLLWEELDVKTHPTDEHCVQIDEILQYLVEDIEDVILSKANKKFSKNGDGPPQNDGDITSVGANLRRLEKEIKEIRVRNKSDEYGRGFRFESSQQSHQGIKGLPRANIVDGRGNSMCVLGDKKSPVLDENSQSGFFQKRNQKINPNLKTISAKNGAISKFISTPYINRHVKINEEQKRSRVEPERKVCLKKGPIKKSVGSNSVQKYSLVSLDDYFVKENEDLEKLKRINKVYKINRDLYSLKDGNTNNIFKNTTDINDGLAFCNQSDIKSADKTKQQGDVTTSEIKKHSNSGEEEEVDKISRASIREIDREKIKKQLKADDVTDKTSENENEEKHVVHEVEIHQEPQVHESAYEDDWESEGNETKGDETLDKILSEDKDDDKKSEVTSSSTSVGSEILDSDQKIISDGQNNSEEEDDDVNDAIGDTKIENNDGDFEEEIVKDDNKNVDLENNEIEVESSKEDTVTENDSSKKDIPEHEAVTEIKDKELSTSSSSNTKDKKSQINETENSQKDEKKIKIKLTLDGDNDDVSLNSGDIESVIKDLTASINDENSKSMMMKEIESLKESIQTTSERLNAVLPNCTNQSTNTSDNVVNNKITESVGIQIEDDFNLKLSPESIDVNNKLSPFDINKNHCSRSYRQTQLINSDCTENSMSSGKTYDKNVNSIRKSYNIGKNSSENDKQLTSVHLSFPDSERNVPSAITMLSSIDNQEIKITFDINKSSRSYEVNQPSNKVLSSSSENAFDIYLSSPRKPVTFVSDEQKIHGKKEINSALSNTTIPRVHDDSLACGSSDMNTGNIAQNNSKRLKRMIETTVEEVFEKYKPYHERFEKDLFPVSRSDKVMELKSEEVQTDFNLTKPNDKLELKDLCFAPGIINHNNAETQTSENSGNAKEILVQKQNDHHVETILDDKDVLNKPGTSHSKILSHRTSVLTSSATTSDRHLTSSFSSSTSLPKSFVVCRETSTATSSDDQLSEGEIRLGSSSCSCSFGEVKMFGCKNCGPYGVKKTSSGKYTNKNRYTWGQELSHFPKDTKHAPNFKESLIGQDVGKPSLFSFKKDNPNYQLNEDLNLATTSDDTVNCYKDLLADQRIVIGCEKSKDSNSNRTNDISTNIVTKNGPDLKTRSSLIVTGKSSTKPKKFSEVVKSILQDLRSEKSSKINSEDKMLLSGNHDGNKIFDTYEARFSNSSRNVENNTTKDDPVMSGAIYTFANKSQDQSKQTGNEIHDKLLKPDFSANEGVKFVEQKQQKFTDYIEKANASDYNLCSNFVVNHAVTDSGDCRHHVSVENGEETFGKKSGNAKSIELSALSDKSSVTHLSKLSCNPNYPIDRGDHPLLRNSHADNFGDHCESTQMHNQKKYSSKFTSSIISNKQEGYESISSGESLCNFLLESCLTDDSSDDDDDGLPSAIALELCLSNSSSEHECSEGQLLVLEASKSTY